MKTLKDQVDIIKRVMNKNKIPDYRFPTGRYAGKLLEYVVRVDPVYLLRLYSTGCKLHKVLQTYIEDNQDELKKRAYR